MGLVTRYLEEAALAMWMIFELDYELSFLIPISDFLIQRITRMTGVISYLLVQ